MTVSHQRLVVESVVAGLFGLAPHGLRHVVNWVSGTEQSPHLVTRATYVLGGVLYPGGPVGVLVGAALDIAGFTTDWAYLRRVESIISTLANCVLFAVVWAIFRGLPKTARLRRVTKAVVLAWVLSMIPFFAFGSLWMVLGP